MPQGFSLSLISLQICEVGTNPQFYPNILLGLIPFPPPTWNGKGWDQSLAGKGGSAFKPSLFTCSVQYMSQSSVPETQLNANVPTGGANVLTQFSEVISSL